jgi:hypothetical protein
MWRVNMKWEHFLVIICYTFVLIGFILFYLYVINGDSLTSSMLIKVKGTEEHFLV